MWRRPRWLRGRPARTTPPRGTVGVVAVRAGPGRRGLSSARGGPEGCCCAPLLQHALCYAIMLPGWKSVFRPDSNRQEIKIGHRAGLRPAGRLLLRISRLESGKLLLPGLSGARGRPASCCCAPLFHSTCSAELEGLRKLKGPAGELRFRAGFWPQAGPNQAQTIRHGAHRPAHNDSERFWPDHTYSEAPSAPYGAFRG